MSQSKPISLMTPVTPQSRFLFPVIDPQAGSGEKNVAVSLEAILAQMGEVAVGSQIYAIGTTPSEALGNNGDYAIDVNTGGLYGPKAAGAWPGTAILLTSAADAALATSIANETTRAQLAEAELMPNTQAALVELLNGLPTSITGRSVGDWVVLNGIPQKLQP